MVRRSRNVCFNDYYKILIETYKEICGSRLLTNLRWAWGPVIFKTVFTTVCFLLRDLMEKICTVKLKHGVGQQAAELLKYKPVAKLLLELPYLRP